MLVLSTLLKGKVVTSEALGIPPCRVALTLLYRLTCESLDSGRIDRSYFACS